MPSSTWRRGAGNRTIARNPPRSNPKWLDINCISPRNTTATAALATKGWAAAGTAVGLFNNTLAPTMRKINTLVARAIFTSGARDIERKLARATAAASSGIAAGSVHSSKSLRRAAVVRGAEGFGLAAGWLFSPPW